MRIELKRLHRELGITTIYVTHDQAEALALSDRIVFMSGGRIVEIGTPQAVYRTPQARSTAEFLGVANIVEGHVLAVVPGGCSIATPLGRIDVMTSSTVRDGDSAALCLRPEDIRLSNHVDRPGRLSGTIRHAAYMGSMTDYLVDLPQSGLTFRVQVPGSSAWNLGDTVSVTLPQTAAVIRQDAAPQRAAPRDG
jgi:ABC-type Fe3+/spermidine/putrescine transport system ATPase subunit